MYCKYCGTDMQGYIPGFKFATVLPLDFGDYECSTCGAKMNWVCQGIERNEQLRYSENWTLPTREFETMLPAPRQR